MYVLVLFMVVGFMTIWGMSVASWQGSFLLISYVLKESFFSFFLDDISLVAWLMLFCCGGLALFYCYHYFLGSTEGGLLSGLIVWFLCVMGVLVVTSSLMFSLVLWEYLGLVSFFLILFYSNSTSLRASLITVFASRFGDVSLFLLIMWLSSWADYSSLLFVAFFMLVVLTKSAAYPFISWLLEAMRAPTPVSSLVHSSTLVAAGVWFFCRYGYISSVGSLGGLFFFSIVSVIISGLCAVVFTDLKKIVALSTCNNISWCVIFFIFGDLMLALVQLLSHGVAKCFLFMSVGDLMSTSGGSQNSSGVYVSRYLGLYGVVCQAVLIFSLCGFPFLGVFFSKHGLFSMFLYNYNVVCLGLLLTGFLISYIYSVRFSLLLFKGVGGINCGYLSSYILISLVCFFSSLINFCGSVLFLEYSELSSFWSLGFVVLQLLGCVTGVIFFVWNFGVGGCKWNSLLWGSESLVAYAYSIYLRMSEVCFFSFYRWEVYLFGIFKGWVGKLSLFSGSIFSLNVLVLGLLFVVLFYFVVY
uniref:NADH dehydrogenase subunit 5 n=1 Tax=Ogmocotyle ailuri TaxID=2935503 RepID=UPI0023AA2878|nr:NADH dehydrogenase subunit 5 [Ogmocotyle ailuri]WCO09242.1 NADH dehydrogenase subunit 5 [Ogmocotyle ailuri]